MIAKSTVPEKIGGQCFYIAADMKKCKLIYGKTLTAKSFLCGKDSIYKRTSVLQDQWAYRDL